jgi:hypothetical protein
MTSASKCPYTMLPVERFDKLDICKAQTRVPDPHASKSKSHLLVRVTGDTTGRDGHTLQAEYHQHQNKIVLLTVIDRIISLRYVMQCSICMLHLLVKPKSQRQHQKKCQKPNKGNIAVMGQVFFGHLCVCVCVVCVYTARTQNSDGDAVKEPEGRTSRGNRVRV